MRLFLTIITTGILALVPIQSECLDRLIDGGKSGGLIKTCSDHGSAAESPPAKVKPEKEAGKRVYQKNRDHDDLQLQKFVHQSIAGESLDNEPLTRRYVPVKVGPSTGLNWYQRRMHVSPPDFGVPKGRAMENQESGTVKELDDDLESDPRASFSSGTENNLREESAGENEAMERSLSTSEKPEVEVTGSEKPEGKISAGKSFTFNIDASVVRERRKKGKRRPHYRPRPRPRQKSKRKPKSESRSRNFEEEDDEHRDIESGGFFISGPESSLQEESTSDGPAMERTSSTSERQNDEVSETDEPNGEALPPRKLSDFEKALAMDFEDPAIRERRKKGKKRPHHRPRPRPRPKPKPESGSRYFEEEDHEHPEIDPGGFFISGPESSLQEESASDDPAKERSSNTSERQNDEVSETDEPNGEALPPRELSDFEKALAMDFEDPAIRERRKKGKKRPHHRPRPRPKPKPESGSRNIESDDEHPDIDPRGSFSSDEIVALERSSSTSENPEVEVAGTKNPDGKKIIPRMLGDGTADFDESALERRWRGFFRPRMPRLPRLPRPRPMPRPRPIPRPRPKPRVKPRPRPRPRPKIKPRPKSRPHTNINSDTRLDITASLDNLGGIQPAPAPNYEENYYDVGNENGDTNVDHHPEEEQPVDEEVQKPEEEHTEEEGNIQVIPLATKRNGGAFTENSVARILERILGIDRAYDRRYASQDLENLQSFMRRISRPNSELLYDVV